MLPRLSGREQRNPSAAAAHQTEILLNSEAIDNATKPNNVLKAPITELPEFSYTVNPMASDEFGKLPQTGKVDPKRIRTLQVGASRKYKPDPETGKTYTVIGTTNQLRDNPEYADKIEPIRIVQYGDRVYTLDHRRLVAHRLADVPINYKKVAPNDVARELRDKLDSNTDDGLKVKIRHGPKKGIQK